MGKPKLEKFSELDSFPNVFQNYKYDNPTLINCHRNEVDLKSRWKSTYFENNNPLILELACGKGDYTIQLAERFPESNFIGIDVKGNRIWAGAKYGLENHLDNVAFIRTRIEYIADFFEKGEVDEIWITFPDPFPRKGDKKRRLSNRRFLDIYKSICKTGGVIHFKTDNKPLFDYSIEEVTDEGYTVEEVVSDIYAQPDPDPVLRIQTHYEKMHLAEGRKIYYFRFII